ncbi:hypothetical protein [Clostridium drakei]|uniref:Uncharacterized protein n=1 Tax=Clostridium drakei TaxID=332101 RepID=A0A2U8DVZ3_9CLOT|nr:hypothetical protein [Clostridium drakei]AWI06943.1 hypothetical protein B9W14_21420 [Clostridium drakei]
MIYNNKCSFVVRNSKNIFYKFTLNNQKNLFLQSYDYRGLISSSIFKENINNFSIDIDSMDKIHILYTSINGTMRYTVYPSSFHKDINLLNINEKYNISFLKLKIVNFKPHVFYILEDKLQSSYKSIHHIFLHNNSLHNIKIEDIPSSKYIYPYIVDAINNTMYLFCTKNGSKFIIKKFNVNLANWTTYDDTLSISSTNNASFLINNKNILLICYNSSFNKNIQTFIKYKELNSYNCQWSDPIILSDKTSNSTHATIINKSGNTYVVWEENGQIVYKKSFYGTNDWSSKKILTNKKEKFFTGIYLSNHNTDKDYKSILSTIDINNIPYPIINLENNNSNSFYINKDQVNSSLFIPRTEKTTFNNKKEKKQIQKLQCMLAEKEKKIIELSQCNLILKNELETKNKELENLNEKLKKNWLSKFFK